MYLFPHVWDGKRTERDQPLTPLVAIWALRSLLVVLHCLFWGELDFFPLWVIEYGYDFCCRAVLLQSYILTFFVFLSDSYQFSLME